jgi:PAS domain-containing protein
VFAQEQLESRLRRTRIRCAWAVPRKSLLLASYTKLQTTPASYAEQKPRNDLEFRLISDNAADMIAVVDMNGNRIYNSQSYQRVLEYDENELKSSSAFDQIHEDDRVLVRAGYPQMRFIIAFYL